MFSDNWKFLVIPSQTKKGTLEESMNGGSIWQLVVVDTKIKDKREKVPLQSAVYAAVREQSFSSKIILSLPGTIMPHSNKEG